MTKTMDRQIIITLAIVALAFASMAQAAMIALEEAYELDLTQVILPVHESDQVTLKECDDCFTKQLPVNYDTRYHVGFNSSPVTLRELMDFVGAIGNREDTPIYVMYEPESLVVTRIVLGTASR